MIRKVDIKNKENSIKCLQNKIDKKIQYLNKLQKEKRNNESKYYKNIWKKFSYKKINIDSENKITLDSENTDYLNMIKDTEKDIKEYKKEIQILIHEIEHSKNELKIMKGEKYEIPKHKKQRKEKLLTNYCSV